MKRITGQFAHSIGLAIAVVLLAFMVITCPSPSRAASSESGGVSKANPVGMRTEARIKELHTKLKITPDQEEQWSKVTQVMRDNAKTMDAMIKARSEKAGTLTAVEDLKSYGEFAEAHAEGIKKFIPVFETLYDSMSETQQKEADLLFRHHPSTKSKKAGK